MIESLSVRSSCFKTLSSLSGLVLSRTQVSGELGLYLWISLHSKALGDWMTMVSFKVKKITVPSCYSSVTTDNGIRSRRNSGLSLSFQP